MPREPPVTSAVFPARLLSMGRPFCGRLSALSILSLTPRPPDASYMWKQRLGSVLQSAHIEKRGAFMLRLAAVASILMLVAGQDKSFDSRLTALAQDKPDKQEKPAAAPKEDAEEFVAAKKGDLTPLYELEATYEASESAEVKLKLEAYQGDLTIQKVAAAGEQVKKGDVLLALDR